MTSKRILLGRIGAAHGVRGEVRITAFTQSPEAIAAYGALETDRAGLTIEIVDLRLKGNQVIARLKGVADRTAAEKLNGMSLYCDRTDLPEPEDEDEFYHADLIGLEARLEDGHVLGEVMALPNFGAGDLLEVRDPRTGDTFLYPFTKAIVPQIDLERGFVVIRPPVDAEPGEEEPD